MRGHFLKLYFYMFEKWQMKHNSLDCHYLFRIFFIIAKFTSSKLNIYIYIYIIIFIFFACSKHSNLKNGQCFFSNVLFLPNVHHFFWKLTRILTLMIRRAKGFELVKIIFMIDLNTFGSKVLLILKIMDFENVPLTKIVHVYVIEDMNA